MRIRKGRKIDFELLALKHSEEDLDFSNLRSDFPMLKTEVAVQPSKIVATENRHHDHIPKPDLETNFPNPKSLPFDLNLNLVPDPDLDLDLDMPMLEEAAGTIRVKPESGDDLPRAFKDEILKLDGSNPTLVLKKKLFKKSPLTMPRSQVLSRLFLKANEEWLLEDSRDDDEKKDIVGFPVLVIDPELRIRLMMFEFWKLGNSFVLNGDWNQLHTNDDELHIWSFRIQPADTLAFALVKRGSQMGAKKRKRT